MKDEKMYGSSLKGMRSALKETLLELGQRDERVVVIDCETATATNIISFKHRFPERFVELGICEQNAVSFAFGVARSGLIPIVALFGSFLTRRACDQVFIQAGYAEANIKLIGCYSGLTTPNTGATHQSINDVSIVRSIPRIVVLEACDEVELRLAIMAAVEYQGPVYVRMIRGDIAPYEKRVVPAGHLLRIGKSSRLTEGSDITLIGSGMMVSRCLEAAHMLEAKGIHADVINCSSIKPLDKELILESARKTGGVVTAENHSIIGGMGSAVAELLSEEYPVKLRRVGIRDRFGESAPLEDLFPHHGLTSEAIVNSALAVLGE